MSKCWCVVLAMHALRVGKPTFDRMVTRVEETNPRPLDLGEIVLFPDWNARPHCRMYYVKF